MSIFILSISTGIGAAFLWGICDLLAKLYIPRWGGSTSWVLWSQTAGAVLYALYFLAFPEQWPPLSWAWIGLLALFGLVGLGGYLFFFRAIERGSLSLVSPIASSWAGVSFLLSAFLLPTVLSWTDWTALLLVLGGVVAVSYQESNTGTGGREHRRTEVLAALASALCWGIYNFSLKFLGEKAGPLVPVLAVKLWGAGFAIAMTFGGKLTLPTLTKPLLAPSRVALLALPFVALLDILAYVLYIRGTQVGVLPIVAAFASLFSLFTTLFGTLVLKERLSRIQLFGVALIVVGGFTLGLLD